MHDLGFVRVVILYGVIGWTAIGTIAFTGITLLIEGADPFTAYGIDPLRYMKTAVVVGACFGAFLWLVNEVAYRREFRDGSAL
jgi:hypothetical protein